MEFFYSNIERGITVLFVNYTPMRPLALVITISDLLSLCETCSAVSGFPFPQNFRAPEANSCHPERVLRQKSLVVFVPTGQREDGATIGLKGPLQLFHLLRPLPST